jgi:hypothetical protein
MVVSIEDLQKITIPTPPRLTGDSRTDLDAFVKYSYQLYSAVVVQGRLLERINALAALEPVSETVSGSPTQAEVVAIAQKINAIINAAG